MPIDKADCSFHYSKIAIYQRYGKANLFYLILTGSPITPKAFERVGLGCYFESGIQVKDLKMGLFENAKMARIKMV